MNERKRRREGIVEAELCMRVRVFTMRECLLIERNGTSVINKREG